MKLTMRALGVFLVSGMFAAVPGAVAEEVPAPAAVPPPVVVVESKAVADSVPDTGPDAAARSPWHELVVRAIHERRLLHFTYAGHSRVVEPYAYGVSATGEAVLHGYQVAGGSASKPPPGWRTFAVSGISELVETERRFAKTREDYSTERPKLDPQWAEVEGVKTSE